MKKSLIDKIKKYLKEKPVLRAYIFGSFARNELEENSDIDILVELDYSQSIGLEFVEMQFPK
jgi:predicted nucleotidyltransferase